MTPPEINLQRPRVLISVEDLEQRITELAAEIDRDYAGKDPFLAIGVLKGSVFFMVDLLKQVQTPLQIGFFQTSSYGSGTTAGEIRIRKDVDISVRGRDVLLIEDIVDTGYTLRTIMALLEFRGARSVKLCTMLDKVGAREVDIPIHYTGFPIDNVFVVGYGLDLDDHFRNLPYIGIYEGEHE
jgi:hypoxanthine phosphoribosyltransferase